MKTMTGKLQFHMWRK